MAPLTLAERVALERLVLARRLGTVRAGLVGTPLSRASRSVPSAEALVLVPRELRTADPSFASELAAGLFGLAGRTVDVAGRSVFEVVPPDRQWERALHAFGWLRNLAAAGDDASRATAGEMVHAWIRRHGTRAGRWHGEVAWEGSVAGRRLMSWLYNADVLLEGKADADYARLMSAIGGHVGHLARTWRTTADGIPRLTALTALAMAAVTLDGQTRLRTVSLAALGAELDRQVLADGGHVSRHPGALIEPLLDLLSLLTCLRTERLPIPPAIEAARDRALVFLRFMRHPDGALARFNGMAAAPLDRLSTLASHATDTHRSIAPLARQSRYVRLEADAAVLIADLGTAPAPVLAGSAAAGALSFELTIDGETLLQNLGGAPEPSNGDLSMRLTPTHTTLVLAAASSARLVDDPAIVRLAGAPVMFGPPTVEIVETPNEQIAGFTARHDGYVGRFGLWHTRRIRLGSAEALVAGEDLIDGRGRPVRLARDVAFAIHFHIAPAVRIAAGATPGTALLITRAGRRYAFGTEGAAVSIEESAQASRFEGQRPGYQIVLRGASYGESRVTWRLTRV